MQPRRVVLSACFVFISTGFLPTVGAFAQRHARPAASSSAQSPWMNTSLGPDERADLVLHQMTQAEKLQMVDGIGWGVLRPGHTVPADHNGGAGYIPGIERLGIPAINLADSAVGIRMAGFRGRYATLLPSTLGAAASWDPDSAQLYGDVIGRELRAEGFNMSIGGGVNIMREPRNGRNFEYAGEDPLLAGTMTGNLMKGMARDQVMTDIKHYALNDQETGRTKLNAIIPEKAMRESDLLAFQIAIGIAKPSAVMCSYNEVNGDYACENDYLLNQVLKKEWGFKGWVVSDWQATHSTAKAALAGLDMEQPGGQYFNQLGQAIADGKVPQSRLDDMVHRILRSMFAAGVIDNPPVPYTADPFKGRDDAQHIAEEGIVLLRNQNDTLPIKPSIHSIVLIGGHADVGVLSGAGSAQVDPPGGDAANPSQKKVQWSKPVYFPSSPLKELSSQLPGAHITYVDGSDPTAAATAAKSADLAIVFTVQPMSEGHDARTLSLPNNQDALVQAVAGANHHTVVVIESGGPVTMPWHDQVAGIVEAWYPGIGGAQALARLLTGAVDFSGKLPATFPASDADLPHPTIPGMDLVKPGDDSEHVTQHFDVHYTEGARVGYKWFDSENKTPLFPFGFGLSYTRFGYSAAQLDSANRSVSFTLTNSGQVAGTEIAQVYVELPTAAGENYRRLAGWARVPLAPGESKHITVPLNPLALSVWNTGQHSFEMLPGEYKISIGSSSRDLPLHATLSLDQEHAAHQSASK